MSHVLRNERGECAVSRARLWMRMNLSRANACQSAVEVTRCLLLCPLARFREVWIECRLTKGLFPPKSLRYMDGDVSPNSDSEKSVCVCLSLKLPRQTPDGATRTHKGASRWPWEKLLCSPKMSALTFICFNFSTLNPTEFAPNLISSFRVPKQPVYESAGGNAAFPFPPLSD